MTDPSSLLVVSLLGGLLALDATSVGQFMFSRPLVAGSLTGWLTGDFAFGLQVGALLELYLLVAFPTGGSSFPEGSTAAVVAVASAALAGVGVAVPLSVAAGLLWGHVAGASITVMRKVHGRLIPEPEDTDASAGRITRAHATAMALDFLRGVTMTLAGVVVGPPVLARMSAAWPMEPSESLSLVLVGAAVSGGVLLRSFGGFRRRKYLFVAGVVLGFVGMRLL